MTLISEPSTRGLTHVPNRTLFLPYCTATIINVQMILSSLEKMLRCLMYMHRAASPDLFPPPCQITSVFITPHVCITRDSRRRLEISSHSEPPSLQSQTHTHKNKKQKTKPTTTTTNTKHTHTHTHLSLSLSLWIYIYIYHSGIFHAIATPLITNTCCTSLSRPLGYSQERGCACLQVAL